MIAVPSPAGSSVKERSSSKGPEVFRNVNRVGRSNFLTPNPAPLVAAREPPDFQAGCSPCRPTQSSSRSTLIRRIHLG